VVDISADFRYASAAAYEAVYKHPHGAPARIAQFTCAVPEHLRELKTPHVAHPGCFATTILLAAVPLLALDLIEPQLFVAAVTGSTGSGRKPVEGTHHPLRHGDLYAYNALAHRHTAEIIACAKGASGVAAHFAFVPHSGPYARGIHATVQAVLKRPLSSDALRAQLRDFYATRAVRAGRRAPPRLKDVAASGYARLGAVSDGRTVAVMSVADNLNKGAAGGAMQWMNRLLGFPETMGLTAPAAPAGPDAMNAALPSPSLSSAAILRVRRFPGAGVRAVSAAGDARRRRVAAHGRRAPRARSVWRTRGGGARLCASGLDARAAEQAQVAEFPEQRRAAGSAHARRARLLLSRAATSASVFFVNSGAEANENALKMAFTLTRRSQVVALEHSFHGRTAAAGAITWGAAAKWYGFPRTPFDVRFLPRRDARRSMRSRRTPRPSSSSRCRAWAAPSTWAPSTCARCASAAMRPARADLR
jgi:N-acetyl-gamma-glutamyl-phosphate reductase common form